MHAQTRTHTHTSQESAATGVAVAFLSLRFLFSAFSATCMLIRERDAVYANLLLLNYRISREEGGAGGSGGLPQIC